MFGGGVSSGSSGKAYRCSAGRPATTFAAFVAAHDPDEMNRGSTLLGLIKPWREENKIGFNGVELEKTTAWLGDERASPLTGVLRLKMIVRNCTTMSVQ